MIYASKQFWLDSAERAIKSAAQGAVLGWGTVQFTNVGEIASAAVAVGYGALFMFVLSLLTSIASVNIGTKGTPSLSPVLESSTASPDDVNENDKLGGEDE